MAIFALSELYDKVTSNQWSGEIILSDTKEQLTVELLEFAISQLTTKTSHLLHGDKILVRVISPLPAIAIMLAAWQKGLVVVPVKGDASKSTLEVIANDCNAKAIIDGDKIIPCNHYTEEESVFSFLSCPKVNGSDLAMIIYTSGSTGTPKGIMLTHNSVVTSLKSISKYLRIDSDEVILGLSPLSFDYGLYQVLFAIFNDCQLILTQNSFHPLKVIKLMDEYQVSLLPLVPAMANSLEKIVQITKNKLPSLKKITNTGGHLSEAVIQAWKKHCPDLSVFAMYGLTECKRALYLEPEKWLEKIGSVGKPVPGLEAKLFRESLVLGKNKYKEVASGEVGELFVRGSALMQCYYNSNAKGGAQIIAGRYRDDNWLATGDLFIKDEEGYFYFKGRSKELIKQAGFCIYPTEVEAIIEKCEFVNLAAIIPSEDRFADEIACLFIQLHQSDLENQEAFKSWLNENVESDYRPRVIKFTEEMALTANGKIDKKFLVDCL